MPEKYQKLPPHLRRALNPSGRTVLARGGDLIAPEVRDAPAATVAPDAPRRAPAARKGKSRPLAPAKAPAPPACAVERPASWPDDWLASEAGPVHAPCGTLLRQASAAPRLFCATCGEEWFKDPQTGHWKRVGTR